MSRTVKKLVKDELIRRFEGMTSMAVVGFTGVDGVTTNKIRGRLREKEIKLTVVKNSLARQAFEAVGVADAKDLLDGPCAVAFGLDPDNVTAVEIVREILDIGKEAPELKVKAALLEGETFGPERVKELGAYPTRIEAVQKAVACVLSPGGKLAACIMAPGQIIASLLKSIQDGKQDENESPDEQAA